MKTAFAIFFFASSLAGAVEIDSKDGAKLFCPEGIAQLLKDAFAGRDVKSVYEAPLNHFFAITLTDGKDVFLPKAAGCVYLPK